jgi:hypothetical protein
MPDEQSLIAEALRLKAENPSWGYKMIADHIPGMDRHKVRRAVEHAERKAAKLPAVIALAAVPALSFYDTACRALAQAKTLKEVENLSNWAETMAGYAKRAKDRTLLDDAEEMIVRAERRLGEMLKHIKETAGFAKGGKPYQGSDKATGPDLEPVARPATLEELGIDKPLSSRAQKLASISERAIEAQLAARRASPSRGNERVTTEILRGGPINGARSVMSSRQEPDDSLDYFPTPPWATRALMERVFPRIGYFGTMTPNTCAWKVWEPACGEGHMLAVLEEYFRQADGSDIHNYNGNAVIDFLGTHDLDSMSRYDWIITNPPFTKEATERFILRALDLASVGIAMFVRSQWIVEGVGRYERIFRDRPPTLIAFFSERVPLHKGRWEPDGATATAYCWLVWVRDRLPLAPFWIPPGCRAALSRPDDRTKFAAWSIRAEAAE